MKTVSLRIDGRDGSTAKVDLSIDRVLLAGYTGRDQAKVMAHIEELKELGVAPPERVPMVYVVDAELLTTENRIVVSEAETSGEAEFYVTFSGGDVLVGVGSDHTDRKHEAIDVAASKGLCNKVISSTVWRYREIQDHWDQIEIRSWATDDAGRRLYQEGRLDAFLRLNDVLAALEAAGHGDVRSSAGGGATLVFGGTLPTLGGLSYARQFEAELRDPALDRAISCAYDIEGS